MHWISVRFYEMGDIIHQLYAPVRQSIDVKSLSGVDPALPVEPALLYRANIPLLLQ